MIKKFIVTMESEIDMYYLRAIHVEKELRSAYDKTIKISVAEAK